MTTRTVARAEWDEFLRTFSNRHHGWIASITLGVASREQPVTPGRGHRQVLQDVVFEDAHVDGDALVFVLAADGHELAYRVHAPSELAVAETARGEDLGLTVLDHHGERSLLRFRTPAIAETLDGLAATER